MVWYRFIDHFSVGSCYSLLLWLLSDFLNNNFHPEITILCTNLCIHGITCINDGRVNFVYFVDRLFCVFIGNYEEYVSWMCVCACEIIVSHKI